MKDSARSPRRLITGFLIAAICAAAVARPKAAGPPTPQLSDNRGDTILNAPETTEINTHSLHNVLPTGRRESSC